MTAAPIPTLLDCNGPDAWEAWLAAHHATKAEIWLRIAKKGAPGLVIEDALDVALCHGWIDSHRRGHDASSFLQRYSPRRARSPWSLINVRKAEALIAAGRMQPAGFAEIALAKADGRWAAAYESQRIASVPDDLVAALSDDVAARQAFDQLDRSAQYALMLPLLKATTPAAREKQLLRALARLSGDQQPIMAGPLQTGH